MVWATGYRPDYGWLDVPVVDAKGRLVHDGGVVVDSPGLYALGLPVLRRRKSTFIHGIEDDARDVVDDLARRPSRAPVIPAGGSAVSGTVGSPALPSTVPVTRRRPPGNRSRLLRHGGQYLRLEQMTVI